MRGVTILYDQATEGTMAPVAIAMADTFVGFPIRAPRRRRGAARRRIWHRDRGDEPRRPRCAGESPTNASRITVPGFGHAERIAEDKANDLALLRLYGARNLVPATLGGDGGTGADSRLSASPIRWHRPATAR